MSLTFWGAKTPETPETCENIPNMHVPECLLHAELCEFQRTLWLLLQDSPLKAGSYNSRDRNGAIQ